MGIISNETVKFWQANAKSVQYYIDLPYKKPIYFKSLSSALAYAKTHSIPRIKVITQYNY